MYLTLAAVLAALVATDIFDVRMTEIGIKKGVAVEANTFLVGQKPSARALYLRDTGTMILTAIPSLIAALRFTAVLLRRLSSPGRLRCPARNGRARMAQTFEITLLIS